MLIIEIWEISVLITCISYGDKKYIDAARFNLETAKIHGADNTILYGPWDLPLSFKLKNWRVYFGRSGLHMRRRGAGFWIWKSYIIKETLSQLKEGDILIYSDGGSVYVNDIGEILKCFDEQQLSVMVFSLRILEKKYTKRDTFVLLNADEPEYTDTMQRLATYIVLRKDAESIAFVNEWHDACKDYRIITDSRNKMGKKNYPEFIDHRHDQSILSITAKKHGIKEYRDPSQWGNNISEWPEDVLERSRYPQIWYSTRDKDITSMAKFREKVKDPFSIEN